MSGSAAGSAQDPQVPASGLSGSEDEDPFILNLDDAEAILQPALSAQARHLASENTPAIEKVAALDRNGGDGLFDIASDVETDSDLESPSFAPETTTNIPEPPKPNLQVGNQPTSYPVSSPPSPWQAQPKSPTTARPSKGILGIALGTTRNRSRSAGQEAWRRLSKALPSLNLSSHLLSSLPSSFFSNSTEKHSPGSLSKSDQSTSPTDVQSRDGSKPASQTSYTRPLPQPARVKTIGLPPPSSTSHPRPRVLRRVTSDDSVLYHSLSRASSLGDDNQFQDVREMVNVRFMALKDSLPDVPNLKMPSFAKISNHAKRASLSLHTVYSSEMLGNPNASRETKAASKDPSAALDRVLEELTGDVVIMGGYRGSILRSAEPPHQQLWAPVKLGLNMRKVNLEVGLEDEDEERMEETVIPSGMLAHIGPIDVSRKFIKKLRSCDNARAGKLRVWDYGYDWRLSPSLLSRKLQEFLKTLPSNQLKTQAKSRGALVIAHSFGGLVTRHAVNQRPDLFSHVLYCGTPQRCVNILNPMRHGDVVLFNEKLLTARVNFSIRSSFAFLPEDGFCFVDKNTGESYPIDFYDPQEWINWHLSPCMQPTLPPYNRRHSTSLSSRIPKSFRPRADSKPDKPPTSPTAAGQSVTSPQLNGNGAHDQDEPVLSQAERERNFEYLGRTLAKIRKFREELAHSPAHQEANAYPPFAVLYSKSIPTVYAAQVTNRDAIRCLDAYDDLLFRPGDGVVLAKEAMLPEGYSLVRGGRVSTERAHMTMMGDLPAMGRALEALLKGRRKGIGLGPSSDMAK